MNTFPKNSSKEATENRIAKEKSDAIERAKIKKEKIREKIYHYIKIAKEIPIPITLAEFKLEYLVADEIGLELEEGGWTPTFTLCRENDDKVLFIDSLILE